MGGGEAEPELEKDGREVETESAEDGGTADLDMRRTMARKILGVRRTAARRARADGVYGGEARLPAADRRAATRLGYRAKRACTACSRHIWAMPGPTAQPMGGHGTAHDLNRA